MVCPSDCMLCLKLPLSVAIRRLVFSGPMNSHLHLYPSYAFLSVSIAHGVSFLLWSACGDRTICKGRVLSTAGDNSWLATQYGAQVVLGLLFCQTLRSSCCEWALSHVGLPGQISLHSRVLSFPGNAMLSGATCRWDCILHSRWTLYSLLIFSLQEPGGRYLQMWHQNLLKNTLKYMFSFILSCSARPDSCCLV